MDHKPQSLTPFQEKLGYRFRDETVLRRALTHPSVQQDDPAAQNNQRMEFLGDAVLQLVISEALHALFPDDREGDLTRRRAALTRGSFLTELARELGVPAVLHVGNAERAVGGHERPAALEDAVEALVAAVYLDAGWETTRRVLLGWIGDIKSRLVVFDCATNPKGRLQELVQPLHGNSALAYNLVLTEGPPHQRRFEVEVTLLGNILARGAGSSKKEAEEEAARSALRDWPAAPA